ncbi:MAG: hypothetical protein COW59_01615 [Lysobacterales bacterium CG17_big_fil_post_rev_8_21_14_2_50_64_11]|nr:MAG: hypothetical protein COW59_01615 [Xanthomonadales bacterium CG17_big_fil_post_rev_8_21_14_2_50_64_11]PIX61766.1 MAG: hypothetical protein COZ47_00230 [Xanthomonadales bacterium CG_4_10_14_3_um_filter_64_11]
MQAGRQLIARQRSAAVTYLIAPTRAAIAARVRLLVLALLAAPGVLVPFTALAAQFTLAPTRVHLAPGQVAQTLLLGNEDDREVSFELSYQHWRMDDAGQWLLEDSDDLILHPQIVTVPGNGRAVIRVGTLRSNVAQEEAYRIQMQELPGELGSQGVAVTMLTRLSVPVFVQVRKAQLALELADPVLGADRIAVGVRNSGSRYLSPEDARLIVRDGAGTVLHEDTLGVPYLLVGAQLRLTRPLPATVCRNAQVITLLFAEAKLEVSVPVVAANRQCGG